MFGRKTAAVEAHVLDRSVSRNEKRKHVKPLDASIPEQLRIVPRRALNEMEGLRRIPRIPRDPGAAITVQRALQAEQVVVSS